MPHRLLRFAVNAATTLSLLAALLAAALWATALLSHSRVARAGVWLGGDAGAELSARADRRSLCLCLRRPVAPPEFTPIQWATWAESRARLHTEFHLMGFRYLRGPVAAFGWSAQGAAIKRADHWLVLGVPAPLALAALLAPPLYHWPRALRCRRRLRRGLCARCGDDPGHGRGACPECSVSAAAPAR